VGLAPKRAPAVGFGAGDSAAVGLAPNNPPLGALDAAEPNEKVGVDVAGAADLLPSSEKPADGADGAVVVAVGATDAAADAGLPKLANRPPLGAAEFEAVGAGVLLKLNVGAAVSAEVFGGSLGF
jgi:hypothetical protein